MCEGRLMEDCWRGGTRLAGTVGWGFAGTGRLNGRLAARPSCSWFTMAGISSSTVLISLMLDRVI